MIGDVKRMFGLYDEVGDEDEQEIQEEEAKVPIRHEGHGNCGRNYFSGMSMSGP